MILPVALVKNPGEDPMSNLLRDTFPLNISNGDIVLPTFFSHASVSMISLYTATETG